MDFGRIDMGQVRHLALLAGISDAELWNALDERGLTGVAFLSSN